MPNTKRQITRAADRLKRKINGNIKIGPGGSIVCDIEIAGVSLTFQYSGFYYIGSLDSSSKLTDPLVALRDELQTD